MSGTQKKPEAEAKAPVKTQGERLSEEDLAYVTDHLSDEQLEDVTGGSGGFGEAGEAG